jgi:hypothetical protein
MAESIERKDFSVTVLLLSHPGARYWEGLIRTRLRRQPARERVTHKFLSNAQLIHHWPILSPAGSSRGRKDCFDNLRIHDLQSMQESGHCEYLFIHSGHNFESPD